MRLTNKELKEKFGFYPLNCGNIGWVANEGTDKLGKFEDIEDDLDIDLILLGKAIKGIWVKDNDNIYYVGSPYICYAESNKRELEIQFRVSDTWYYFKDYGKTWALTKEELLLSKYIGKYVSFDINDLAYLPLPKIVEGKDMRDNNHHFEGILCANTGTRSHFSLDTELGGIAILDKDIPFIENFKVKEN